MLRPSLAGSLAATVVAVALVASSARGHAEANQPLKATYVQWTKKLHADFRDLNATLRSGADSLEDYVTKLARFYVIARRIQANAARAQDELEQDIASGAEAKLAKRRAIKAFDLLARAGAQWEQYAKCVALGKGGVVGVIAGCQTSSVVPDFFDVFDTLSIEAQAALEQELQGYIRRAKALSRNASTLLRLANEGLGNPLKVRIDTGTKAPDRDAPVVEEDFAIVSASLPSTVRANGPRGDLTVTWSGNPTFPVRMVYAPDACPPGVNCSTPVASFNTRANPLVFKGAIWCAGTIRQSIFFDYSVYLEDAKRARTAKKNADFTCLPG